MIRRILMFMGILVMMSSVSAPAALAAPKCNSGFLTFPAWYDGLTDSNCEIKEIGQGKTSLRNFAARIILNITEIILQLVAYASLIFVIVGGFRYMVAAGSPDGMAAAKKTITNALIGLIISIFSVAIVNAAGGLF